MRKHTFIEGASSSLNKTITEIVNFAGTDDPRIGVGVINLRDSLNFALADFGEEWFKKGISHGHQTCRERYEDTGRVPAVIKYKCTRTLFRGNRRTVRGASKIR